MEGTGDPIDDGMDMATLAECSSRSSRRPSAREWHTTTECLCHLYGWQRDERWKELIPDPKAPRPWFERLACWQEVGASGVLD
jgi:hypothetical protein